MATMNDKEYMQAWILILVLVFSVGFLLSLIYRDHVRSEPACVSDVQRAAAGILVDSSNLRALKDCRLPFNS